MLWSTNDLVLLDWLAPWHWRRGGLAGVQCFPHALSANMTGLSRLATRISISAAVCRSTRSCAAFGNAVT